MRGRGTVALTLPSDIDPERSTVTFALGSSPIVAMRTHYEKLRAYPYYCTEQIVTVARALLALHSAERVLGDSTMITHDSISVMQDVQRAVNEVARRQTWEGYFTYFPGSFHIESLWMTAYVGTFLLEAEAAGVRVPKSVIDASVRRLRTDLNDPAMWARDTISGAPWERRARARRLHGDRIVVARFLRDARSADVRAEDELFGRAADLSWEDRVVLADLMSRRTGVDGPDTRARAMLADAWRVLNVAGKRIEIPDSLRGSAPFPSHIRPAARLLATTMRIDPQHALIGALAETLIQQGAAERNWTWNTQDYGSAVGALASYVTTQRAATGMRVVLRSHKGHVLMSRAIATSSASGDSVISLRGLVQRGEKGSTRLALEVSTELGDEASMTPLYYAVTVNEVSRKPPVTPNISGISVERWYERFEDGTPVTSATEGDLVRVRLRITVPADRQFVAIEDLLPAGLEAVDLSFAHIRLAGTVCEEENGAEQFALAAAIGRTDLAARPLWKLGRRVVVAVGIQGNARRSRALFCASAVDGDISQQLCRARYDCGHIHPSTRAGR